MAQLSVLYVFCVYGTLSYSHNSIFCIPLAAHEESACVYPPDPGPCKDHTIRWYYDPADTRCKHFTFGGCLGNANNFKTEYDCISSCQGKHF